MVDKIAKAVFISCPEITEHRILVTGRVDTRDRIERVLSVVTGRRWAGRQVSSVGEHLFNYRN